MISSQRKYLNLYKLAPEERVKLYKEVLRLHREGAKVLTISQKLKIWPETVRRQINGSNPLARRLFIVTPCEELSYVIGVIKGDGCLYIDRGRWAIKLAAKDLDFVKEFARCIAKLLAKERPYPILFLKDGRYRVVAHSRSLFEFLRKELDYLKPYINKHPSGFLRGLADSEGSVNTSVYRNCGEPCFNVSLHISNTNLEILEEAKSLLSTHFDIAARIYPSNKAGTITFISGRKMMRKRDNHRLVIQRFSDLEKFLMHIGFSIKRKQEKLSDAIVVRKRHGLKPEAARAWASLYEERKKEWTKRFHPPPISMLDAC